jgi:hypothetical protein
LRLLELKKRPLGTLVIVSHAIERDQAGYLIVHAICLRCKKPRTLHVNNIEAGKTRNCKCNSNRKFTDSRAKVLAERFAAIKQRCSNPKSQSWENYGGRGIKNKFKSALEFVTYMLKELPHKDYRGVDIGRRENNGHYEIGNLRLESRASNARNTRRNKFALYKGESITAIDLHARLLLDYPDTFRLTKGRTTRLAALGVDWKDILKRKARGKYTRRSTTS